MPTLVRLAAGVVIVGHGLLHLIGTSLLWRLGQVGDLHYGDMLPSAPPWVTVAAGTQWLAAAAVFTAAGIALIIGRGIWWWLTLGGVILSLPAVIMNAQFAAAGIVLDGLLLAILAAAQVWRMRRKGAPPHATRHGTVATTPSVSEKKAPA
ncbi:MAG: hypothetical protein HIU88_10335 [Acidobacteria bacterium]|nr:hypothetical protein [Acidobacteriota bacterium]